MNELTTIQSRIHEIRGQRVMLDFDLAEMYGVETRVLNQAVKRNIERFPEDFMFQLTKGEYEIFTNSILKSQNVISNSGEDKGEDNLMSQIVISSFSDKTDWGGSRRQPYAFTELGAGVRGKKNFHRNRKISAEKFASFKTSSYLCTVKIQSAVRRDAANERLFLCPPKP